MTRSTSKNIEMADGEVTKNELLYFLDIEFSKGKGKGQAMLDSLNSSHKQLEATAAKAAASHRDLTGS